MTEARESFELSVVIPCLNEADTLARCIDKARTACDGAGIRAEIVVADNGSSDGSPGIAEAHGARVVRISAPGYGNALMGGIESAVGRYIVMGDADDSYDFLDTPRFVEKLREGHALVQGCRLPAGGGRIMPGAMPKLHRWLGNPLFSYLVRFWFGSQVHDAYCGMRGFTREFYDRLALRCTGMEFAIEMIIKAVLFEERIAELPITLHRDGRKHRAPHLQTFRDGWRTLRLFLLYSPRWLFLVPGLGLLLLGTLGYAIALPGMRIGDVTFDVHTLLFASLFLITGYQSCLFALVAKAFAMHEGLAPPTRERLYVEITLERVLIAAAFAMLAGCVLLLMSINEWRLAGFGDLDYSHTMRRVIPGATLVVLGFQTMLSGFLLSLIRLQRR